MTSINAIKYVPNRISLTFNIPFLSFGTMNLKIGHSLVMPDRLFYHAKSNLCICTTVQRNYPIGSVDLNRNHSSDVLV